MVLPKPDYVVVLLLYIFGQGKQISAKIKILYSNVMKECSVLGAEEKPQPNILGETLCIQVQDCIKPNARVGLGPSGIRTLAQHKERTTTWFGPPSSINN